MTKIALAAATLPDPRRYGTGMSGHAFFGLSAHELRPAVSDGLSQGRAADIDDALRAAPTWAAYTRVWQAVCDAAHHSAADHHDETALVARLFAVPLVIVIGARSAVTLPGVLPDVAAISSLLQRHGALGRTRSLELSNALCAPETLERISPREVYARTHAAGGGALELAPSPIAITEPGEKVHLRFLVGTAIVPATEPPLCEERSNIGAWGMPATRALVAQLAHPGVEVLPLPRSPLDLLRAAHRGRGAQLDAAFSLFVSNALRRFRREVGDPMATIGAYDNGEIRISFSTTFDAAHSEQFRWPLHPLDDLAQISAAIGQLLAECRVNKVDYVTTVMPVLLSARAGVV